MVTLAFRGGLLYDLKMRGGPLPKRYAGLGRKLISPIKLEFEPEEIVLIRDWLAAQPDDIIDVEARDHAVGIVNTALRLAGACQACGGEFVAGDRRGQSRCGRCGARWRS